MLCVIFVACKAGPTPPPARHACSSAAASTVGASAEPSIRTASDAATSYTPTNSVTPTTTPRAANPREENDGGPVPSLRTAWDSAAFSTPTTGATSSATPWAANAPLEENNAGPVPSIRTAWDSAAFSTPTTEATSSATPWAANAPLEENNAGPVPSIRTAWDSAAFSTPTTKATSTATPWAANPPQEQNLQQEQEPATGYTNWTGPAPAGDTGPTDAPGAYSYNAFQTQRCGCSLEAGSFQRYVHCMSQNLVAGECRASTVTRAWLGKCSTQRTCCRCFLPALWETWTPSNLQTSCTNTRHRDLSCCSAERKFLILVLTQSWLGGRFAASIEFEVEGLVISGGSYQSALGILQTSSNVWIARGLYIVLFIIVLFLRLSQCCHRGCLGTPCVLLAAAGRFVCFAVLLLDGACLGLCFVVRRLCCF